MSIGRDRKVIVVGAGLAGSLLACYLAKLGFRVRVYERRGDPRAVGYVGGRSINLALSARGLWGLDGIGLKDEIMRHAIPMRGRIMHLNEARGASPGFLRTQQPEDPNSSHPQRAPARAGAPLKPLVFQQYGSKPSDAINSISRGGLNLALLHAAAREPNVELIFDHRCTDVDIPRSRASFVKETTGESVHDDADLVIGADGAFSAVRGAIMKTDRVQYSQDYLTHGYKELHIPSTAAGEYALDPNALHIWPRGSAMMIALPNPDKSFTCTLFWPFAGEHGLEQDTLKTREGVRAFFEHHYPDAVPMMPTLEDDFLKNPVGSLVTVRCWPWCRHGERGTVAVLGDAAHAIVPFYGQGINAGFEDVRILAECLQRLNGDLRAAFDTCAAMRKPNTDAIAQMALENFVEMRDKVGTRSFLWRKKFEHLVQKLSGGRLVPRYDLVSFSTVPYTEALEAGVRFDRLINWLIANALFIGIMLLGWLASLWLGMSAIAVAAAVAGVVVGLRLGGQR